MQREPGELTRDILFDGELAIWQSRKGYRFGIDSVLLATDLPALPEDAQVIELGAGQGAVALTIALQNPAMTVMALEREPSLVRLLRRNVDENGLKNIEVVEGDLRNFREIFQAHSADLVVCNPPFFRPGERRPSPNQQRAAARHELFGGVEDFIEAAAYALQPRGWLQMITPPLRLMAAMQAAAETDLRPESLRFYHSRARESAYLTQYRWRRGGAPDFRIQPPLFIYEKERVYSREVALRLGRERR